MAVLHSNAIFTLTVCFLHVYKTRTEDVLGKTTDDFDFDGLPGAQHEFKIEVPPGIEECFIQKIASGANLHVSFEVLRGGDRELSFLLRNPFNQIIQHHEFRTDTVMEYKPDIEGDYSICIDNTHARFSTKLVYVYIVTFVMEELSKYVEEVTNINTAVVNFTTSISAVEQSIEAVKMHQSHSRMNVIKDWYLITGNESYVVRWSIIQIAIIVTASAFQVYFVRRLFRVSNVTPTAKPRA